MKNIRIGQKEIIHFIGIGGIGMSGLAQVMKTMGFKIQGSDQSKNKSTMNCTKVGIKVFIGHSQNNIKDAYDEEGFDFSGTKAFDKNTGFRTKSVLNVPLKNHEDEIIGVVQLINARDIETEETIPFSNAMEKQIISLASQGAVALTNQRLVKELKLLFEAFIKLIATAIDKKSIAKIMDKYFKFQYILR